MQTNQQLGQARKNYDKKYMLSLFSDYHLCGKDFANKRSLFFCDNEPVVNIRLLIQNGLASPGSWT